MNETSNETNYGELKAQIQTLQLQVEDLHTRLASHPRTPVAKLFVLSKGMALPALVLLVLVIGAATAAVDALTIGPDGKVGINRPVPLYNLDVDGSARISGPIEATKVNVGSKEASISITGTGLDAGSGLIKGGGLDVNTGKIGTNLTLGGKIVGTAGKLDVTGNVSLSGTHIVFDSKDGVVNWGNNQEGSLFFRALTKQGDTKAYTDRMSIDHNGNVIIPGSVNGERPPQSFEFQGRNSGGPWNHKEMDVQNLCGDRDGCRIVFWMQRTDGVVRGMEGWLFMDRSSRRGWSKTLVWNYEKEWALGTPQKYELLWAHDMCWAFNYPRTDWNRSEGNAFGGTTVSFTCKPEITARITIYDR